MLVDADSILVYKKVRNGYVPAADLPVPVENWNLESEIMNYDYTVTHGVVFLKF